MAQELPKHVFFWNLKVLFSYKIAAFTSFWKHNFPNIFDHFPEILQDSQKPDRRSHERRRTSSKNVRR